METTTTTKRGRAWVSALVALALVATALIGPPDASGQELARDRTDSHIADTLGGRPIPTDTPTAPPPIVDYLLIGDVRLTCLRNIMTVNVEIDSSTPVTEAEFAWFMADGRTESAPMFEVRGQPGRWWSVLAYPGEPVRILVEARSAFDADTYVSTCPVFE